jgi:hypothetical protein
VHKRTTVAAAVALASAIFAAPAFAVFGQLGSARFSTLSGPLTPAAYRWQARAVSSSRPFAEAGSRIWATARCSASPFAAARVLLT